MIYDLFDLSDGYCDAINPQTFYLMIKAVYVRNLYYMPHHELMSIVEFIFSDSISMVYKAFWTKDTTKIIEGNDAYQTTLKHFI